MSDLHQELMDRAYEQWRGEWKGASYEAFVNRLDYAERLAVMTGNLNYQVENGGWAQWMDNGYGNHAATLRSMLLPYVEAYPVIGEVIRLKDRFCRLWEKFEDDENGLPDEELSELDRAYYAINERFMVAMEEILSAEIAKRTRG